MRIVISAVGRGLGSNIDTSFHRSSFFLILDTENNSLIAFENTAKDRPGEIGAMIGQIISDKGVDAVITANLGPKAFEIFEQYGIKVYHGEGIIEDVIRQFEEGRLPEITRGEVLRYTGMKQRKMMTEHKKA